MKASCLLQVGDPALQKLLLPNPTLVLQEVGDDKGACDDCRGADTILPPQPDHFGVQQTAPASCPSLVADGRVTEGCSLPATGRVVQGEDSQGGFPRSSPAKAPLHMAEWSITEAGSASMPPKQRMQPLRMQLMHPCLFPSHLLRLLHLHPLPTFPLPSPQPAPSPPPLSPT